jgi:hypothetical protein
MKYEVNIVSAHDKKLQEKISKKKHEELMAAV